MKFILSFDFTPAILIIAIEHSFIQAWIMLTINLIIRDCFPEQPEYLLQIFTVYVALPKERKSVNEGGSFKVIGIFRVIIILE